MMKNKLLKRRQALISILAERDGQNHVMGYWLQLVNSNLPCIYRLSNAKSLARLIISLNREVDCHRSHSVIEEDYYPRKIGYWKLTLKKTSGGNENECNGND